MRSTGEVMGVAADFPAAFAKAQAAAGARLPGAGTVFLTVTDTDKSAVMGIAAQLHDLGFRIVATRGTAAAISRMGIPVERINKIGEGSPHVVDWIENGDVDLVINTPTGTAARADGYEIRRAAVARGIPCITTIAGGFAASRAIAAARSGDPPWCRCRSCTRTGPGARMRTARAARPADDPDRRARGYGPYDVLSRPTPTARRPTRASSTCSPRPSGGAGERTSGRSCRARSRSCARDGELDFLLEDVGPGTNRLAELTPGDGLLLLGPLGRGFAPPRQGRRPILVGGGVGIAPLAIWGDALDEPLTLLGFRDAAHAAGAALLIPGARVITDDDGFVTDLLRDELPGHVEVYACGPPPMLEAVRALRSDNGVPAQLAMESGMACGYGACFGCVVPTKTGYVRLCVDGPVLDAGGCLERVAPIEFCGIPLAHRIVNGSGTFDAIAARRAFGDAIYEQFPFAAFVSKTVTLEPRQGNPPPRLWELPGGLINSIGLPNKGLDGYLREDLPQLAELPVPADRQRDGLHPRGRRAARGSLRRARRGRRARAQRLVPERQDRADHGRRPARARRPAGPRPPAPPAKPLIVKLTPNCASPADVAAAAEQHGADAVSLINTLRGMAMDPHRPGEPWLGGGTGGVSGPAVRAIALSQVREVRARVALPVVGMGGVQSGATPSIFTGQAQISSPSAPNRSATHSPHSGSRPRRPADGRIPANTARAVEVVPI